MKTRNMKKKVPYVERDISWMYFNQRILLEASRPEVPLLERMGFLGIYSNNLDEFFRVRVATLNRIIEYRDRNIKKEQETDICQNIRRSEEREHPRHQGDRDDSRAGRLHCLLLP